MTALFIAAIIGLGFGLLALVGLTVHMQAKRYDARDVADKRLFDCGRMR